MKKVGGIFWAFLAALIFGLACNKPDEKKSDGDASGPAAAKSSEGEATGSSPETPPPPMDALPANLKHEGFAYYGLGNSGELSFEVISSLAPGPSTGNASSKLVAIEGGAAKFITTRTGPLAQLGDEELEVRPDGIYNTRIGGEPVEPAQLVIPSELPKGKTWTTKGSVKLATGKTLDQNIVYTVVGAEKTKTKAGEFDALKVTAKGEIKFDGKSSQSQVAAWYVKDVGIVKMTISTNEPKGTMTVELLKKPGS